jgi:hypothetical protein
MSLLFLYFLFRLRYVVGVAVGDKFFDWQTVVIHTRNLLQDINRAYNMFPLMDKSYSYIQVCWTSPSDGWLKCNKMEFKLLSIIKQDAIEFLKMK